MAVAHPRFALLVRRFSMRCAAHVQVTRLLLTGRDCLQQTVDKVRAPAGFCFFFRVLMQVQRIAFLVERLEFKARFKPLSESVDAR